MLTITVAVLCVVAQPRPQAAAAPVLLATGDFGNCKAPGRKVVAAQLDKEPGTIATLGDHMYDPEGMTGMFECFEANWERHKLRIRPTIGNHDYLTLWGYGYFNYFGQAAGGHGGGYYSYDLGSWHIVVLNSNCSRAGGCHKGSQQERWLREDLAANKSKCTLAYWHHPLFTSSNRAGKTTLKPFWDALYRYDADVILNAHEHSYQHFDPQDPSGRRDPDDGIRQFVVGTGGARLDHFGERTPNLRTRENDTWGFLKLTLNENGYIWRFVSEPGSRFTDSGWSNCR